MLKIPVYLQILFDVNLNFIEQFDFLEIFCYFGGMNLSEKCVNVSCCIVLVSGVPGARLPLVREVVRDTVNVHVRNITKSTEWVPRGPFFRRFAGPWLVGRTGHCSLGACSSMNFGHCLLKAG